MSFFLEPSMLSDSTSVTSEKQKKWTGTLKGVDWKSLCFPACLPLTIHYFPEHKTLADLYVEYNYSIVIEDNEDFPAPGSSVNTSTSNNNTKNPKNMTEKNRFDHTELPPEEKFMEMISQRISRVIVVFLFSNFFFLVQVSSDNSNL